MAKQSNVRGGGLHSAVVKNVSIKTGQPSTKYSPGGISQIGESVGNHATDGKMLRKGADPVRAGAYPKGSVGAQPLGNEVSLNVGGGGPGTGRKLYGQSGTQCTYTPNPGQSVGGKDILSKFGPETKRKG
jgi:hypothetical protein